ncbi:MAG: four helix bundle protein [Dehalococcoidia bacterium]|nr:four helix bundle protein [Dehalococcoidia bacterium]
MTSARRQRYGQLEVHQRAGAPVRPVHDLGAGPIVRASGFASRIGRACTSIATNIAEGHRKRHSPRHVATSSRWRRGRPTKCPRS